jgi:Phage major coat protein, Gp8
MKKIFALASVLLASSQASMAALPASVSTTFSGIQADGQALFDGVFPIIGLFVGLTVVITLFKRFISKI